MGRRVALLGVLAIAWTMLPVAQAQGLTVVLEDPSDDVATELSGTPATGGERIYKAVDMTGLSVLETVDSVTWIVAVADLRTPTTEDTGADGARWRIFFEHGSRQFLLQLNMFLQVGVPGASSTLSYRDAREAAWLLLWSDSDGAATKLDLTANTVSAAVPREHLADAAGAPPYPGRSLANMTVESRSGLSGASIANDQASNPVNIQDDMPDAGGQPGSYAIVLGLLQSGSARLSSSHPFRASNGEATTFVFQIDASNVGAERETFEFVAVDVPDQIDVFLPVSFVPLDAGETHAVPVLVTVPFAHDHGAQHDFILEMRGPAAGSLGRMRMGVSYLATPQPAGHHDMLYLHTKHDFELGPFSSPAGFMNTLAEDPNDLGVRNFGGGVIIGIGAGWDNPLEPGLQLGLDFDLDRMVKARFTVGSTVPQYQVDLQGSLDVDGLAIAKIEGLAPFDLLPDQPRTFDLELPVSAPADRIDYSPATNLHFRLSASPTVGVSVGAGDGIYLAPGASLQLPLLEYHDDLSTALESFGGPGLTSVSAQQRMVNPGNAVVFQVSITNPGSAPTKYALEFSGPNAHWASMPQQAVDVKAHGNATVSVIVRAPADAVDGDRADLVFQVYASHDEAIRSLIRIVAEVDTDADHPDDAETAADLEKAKKSPPLATGVLLAGLAAAVALVRRRQR